MDVINDINWALIAPLILIQFILMCIALFDWGKSHDYNGPKWMWFFLIIFLGFIGPISYFIFGRKKYS